MKVILTESQFKKMSNFLIESDESFYEDSDFVEVGIKLFRNWVKTKHGDEIGEYPLTYLFKKYFNDFIIDSLGPNYRAQSYGSTTRKLELIGREYVRRQLISLPTLRPNVKFTEKYKRVFNFIKSNLKTPDYLDVKFTEESPYDLKMIMTIDYPKMLKSELPKPYVVSIYSDEVTKYLKDFMGTEMGNPIHGQLKFSTEVNIVNEEDWIKTEWNKKIKKGIKEIPETSNKLRTIKGTIESGRNRRFDVKLGFTRNTYFSEKHIIKQKIVDYLKSLGYNEDNFDINY
jgi:hypothetical protein